MKPTIVPKYWVLVISLFIPIILPITLGYFIWDIMKQKKAVNPDAKKENITDESKDEKEMFGFFNKQSNNEEAPTTEKSSDKAFKVNESSTADADYENLSILELIDLWDRKLAALLKSVDDKTAKEAISIKKVLAEKVDELPITERSKYSKLNQAFQSFYAGFESCYDLAKLNKDKTMQAAMQANYTLAINGARSSLLEVIQNIS